MIIMMTSLLNACSGGMLSLDTDSDSPIDKHPKDSLTDNSGGVNNPQDTPDTDNDSETSPSDDIISGTVRCLDGKGVAGVVVSDGLNAVMTDASGKYILPQSEDFIPKFIFISTPREYSAPVINGLPKFYKSWEECKNLKSVDFLVEPLLDPERYTLLIVADPQIRSASVRSDKVAYHSIDAMDDLFRDMREYASSITERRRCYGVILGDIVHEDMGLFPTYLEQCASLDFPIYSVIGNHDHDTPAVGEDAQHQPYEKYLGPRNYSANLGRFHFISLDNILFSPTGDRSYEIGVSDVDLQWLKNDLSFVPKEMQIVICSHSTMFMKSTGVDVHKQVQNGTEYADLLKGYTKVYNFAGHAHSSFNYVYAKDVSAADTSLQNIEVHVVARSGGLLWLNEYVANGGTPRGYLTCEIYGEKIEWKYRMIPYLSGTNMSDSVPPYSYRQWAYKNGVAYIGDSILRESCQITAYGVGAYPDGCVYANVYMWDEEWEDVFLRMDSGREYVMQRVPRGDAYEYDASEKEIFDHYNTNHPYFKDYGGEEIHDVRHLFRIKPDEKHGKGTILVKDRFGEVFSTSVSW